MMSAQSRTSCRRRPVGSAVRAAERRHAFARRVRAAALAVMVAMIGGAPALVLGEDVPALLSRAESGDARAAFLLGMRYARPESESRDEAEAVRWLSKAAEQGLAEAQYNLGIMYAGGRGVAPDASQAARWYREAAEQGLAQAQYNLGLMYVSGDGVARDYASAAKWFEKAAEQDVAEAAYNLGVLYDLGRGVEADAATAMKWYARAAEQGYHPAASRLAALRAANPQAVAPGEASPPAAPPRAADEGGALAAAAPSGVSEGVADGSPSDEPRAAPSESASAAVPVQAQDAPASARSASAWLARFNPRHYTLQVLSHTDETAVRRFLEERFEDGEAGYFAFELDGQTWYSVVYGDYSSYSAARAAGEALAERLDGSEPWVRKLAIIQKAAIR